MVPNFSQYRNFIRLNPKEVWTKSIPLLKFQIFITIKRGFLGRGKCNCTIFWPQRGHKPPSFPSPTIIFDRVQIAHCTPSIRFDRYLRWKLFHFQLEMATRHEEKFTFELGLALQLVFRFQRVYRPVMLAIRW